MLLRQSFSREVRVENFDQAQGCGEAAIWSLGLKSGAYSDLLQYQSMCLQRVHEPLQGAGLCRCCRQHVGPHNCHVPATAASCQVGAPSAIQQESSTS